MSSGDQFRHCSTCKSSIGYGEKYYKCSVSTCNRKATALYFCSVPCWDAHVPDARHRDAWAELENAPSKPEPTLSQENHKPTTSLRRKVVSATASDASAAATPSASLSELPQDVLIVMSKLKSYLKAHSDMKTSDGVSAPLSNHLRELCSKAILSAQENERKTVLARDIEAALRNEIATE